MKKDIVIGFDEYDKTIKLKDISGIILLNGETEKVKNIYFNFIENSIENDERFIIINNNIEKRDLLSFIDKKIKIHGYSKQILINVDKISQEFKAFNTETSYIINENIDEINYKSVFANTMSNALDNKNFDRNNIIIINNSIDIKELFECQTMFMQMRSINYRLILLFNYRYEHLLYNAKYIINLKNSYSKMINEKIGHNNLNEDIYISEDGIKKTKSLKGF